MSIIESSLYKFITPPLSSFFHRIGLTPNMVTALRFILNFVIIYCLYKKIFIVIPILLVVITYILDGVDGTMARTYGQYTTFGEYFDGTVDVFLVLIILYFFFIMERKNIPRVVYVTAAVIYISYLLYPFLIHQNFSKRIPIVVTKVKLLVFNAVIVQIVFIMLIYHYSIKKT